MSEEIKFTITIKPTATKRRIKDLRTLLSRAALGLYIFKDNDLNPYDDIIDKISLTKNEEEIPWY
jgi:hypothetical protein